MKYISDNNFHIDSLQIALHNEAANTTEQSDLFHTVNSHTFHDLTPNTAYTVTITAVNKAGSGPTVSMNVTTQGASGIMNVFHATCHTCSKISKCTLHA